MEEIKNESTSDMPEGMIEIVSVRFRGTGKSYYFDPKGVKAREGDKILVETLHGIEYGEVSNGNKFVSESEIVPPLRPVIRLATAEDTEQHEKNLLLEKEAMPICEEKIRSHGLDMRLVSAEYTFDRGKLIFYFTADERVDFRELVKELGATFHRRIELRQIGIRDEAKMMGGIGMCGRPFCCSTFLPDFVQVSIKMVKEQILAPNPSKISGACGRLMCCLNYEYPVYEEELRKTPPVGSVVRTTDGEGTIVEIQPLNGMVKVRSTDKQGNYVLHWFSRDDLEIITLAERPNYNQKRNKKKTSGTNS